VAYCDQDDVEAALGRTFPRGFDVDLLCESASDLIDGFINYSLTEPYPGVAVRVAAEMVANVLNRPQPAGTDTVDPYNMPAFQYQVGPQSVGPWISKSQADRLDSLKTHVKAVGITSETVGFVRYGIRGLDTGPYGQL
jgi:hypothetical protein